MPLFITSGIGLLGLSGRSILVSMKTGYRSGDRELKYHEAISNKPNGITQQEFYYIVWVIMFLLL